MQIMRTKILFGINSPVILRAHLGLLITPNDLDDDYDWQLYDVTGHNPNDVFTNHNIMLPATGQGTSGSTGASAAGVRLYSMCIRSGNIEIKPLFAQMPNLIAGHEYLLLVSHFTDSQSGYALSFGGGTAVITDPAEPHLQQSNG